MYVFPPQKKRKQSPQVPQSQLDFSKAFHWKKNPPPFKPFKAVLESQPVSIQNTGDHHMLI